MADTDYLLENYVPVVKYHGLNTQLAVNLGTLDKTGANTIRGYLKLDVRPTGGSTNSYALQIRHNVGATSGLVSSLDHEAHIVATGTASLRGVQGVAVVDSTFTSTGATIIGTYGQARADGTVAGASFMAGVYGLIEASAAITASHVCSIWADSHQNNAVTGSHQLIYATNNGSATLDEMMFFYGSANALLEVSYISSTPYITAGTAADGTPLKVKITINGVAHYLNAYPTDHP